MRRTALAVVAALLAVSPAAAAAAPARTPVPALRQVATAILVDADDGSVILQKGPDAPRAMASTTKLMTALLVLERARPGDVFTAAADYRPSPVESKIDLRPGERMRVGDLLKALLLESANDAAATLAEGVAGSRPAFVQAMNQRARRLGLTGTSYGNPVGLDSRDSYSTARDLATLTRLLLRNERFATIVNSPSAVLQSGARRRVVVNRNDLVARYRFVEGVKTGHTSSAGYVLVGAAVGPLGSRVISVVMGAPSEAVRDADSLALLRYGLSRFHRVRALDGRRAVATAAVKHRDERVRLVPSRSVVTVALKGERIERRVSAPAVLEGELPAGARVGRVTVVRGGEVVDRVPLLTAAEVPGAGPLRVLEDALGPALTLLLLAAVASLVAFIASFGRKRRRARDRAERRSARARPDPTAEAPPPTT